MLPDGQTFSWFSSFEVTTIKGFSAQIEGDLPPAQRFHFVRNAPKDLWFQTGTFFLSNRCDNRLTATKKSKLNPEKSSSGNGC